MLAYTADTWTGVIVGLSIFVPLITTIVLTIVFLRKSAANPDAQRLRRAQQEYEARRKREGR